MNNFQTRRMWKGKTKLIIKNPMEGRKVEKTSKENT